MNKGQSIVKFYFDTQVKKKIIFYDRSINAVSINSIEIDGGGMPVMY